MEACRAGDCPTPPWRTFPMYTSVIFETGILDFSTADLIATAPSSGAVTVTKEPLNLYLVRSCPNYKKAKLYLCGGST